MNALQITIEATVSADLQKAWESYTQENHIVNWNFASDDWHCPSAENDLKTGGKYKARMEAKDGSFGFDFEATYDEVVPMSKIVYTIADGRQCTITFENHGGQTLVRTVFEAESINPPELQKQGWQMILNNYKSYTESL